MINKATTMLRLVVTTLTLTGALTLTGTLILTGTWTLTGIETLTGTQITDMDMGMDNLQTKKQEH
jgi:hypothetical protein